MSDSQHRDDQGRFTEKVTEQDILKVFDFTDEPVLTAQEVADGLAEFFDKDITKEGVAYRLRRMQEKDLVGRKKLGARAVGWWAEVAPRLDPEIEAELEAREEEDEFIPLDEL